ncbi:MAG TPA: ribosome biogenesis GTP-binding protein YihA/YsxC [Bacillota bacterium]|nr:ribosome biogenesis GTP-binding protein YihA/YsxC [Bacillota bacterium]HPF42172.1 ribosome biogenesis GTP-binding protein YihA/YsxC [Bacillota bacterium]HPJ85677.1 ribosome biogenesis GTP-binding protein YihA/YsxC [Bacillota bacterium]HPQ61686.1 ribosome biogenesis GTP-binding protein YihA/YsxC [Bacillota bacterium]HRX91908.1 ribosome biogenesis GTP-binding protein YihA/YsxC [Candidatus Izemoplasmatales bacterium]
MIIRSIELAATAALKKQYPDGDLPEILFAGRSNVGKSSFINSLLNNRHMARVSQTPGKTRLVNFFLINKEFHLVDLPGYGFALGSREDVETFRQRVADYLNSKRNVVLALFLLDIRHKPSKDDIVMRDFFNAKGLPVCYVLTKSDKLSNNERSKSLKLIKETIGDVNGTYVPFSAKTGENKELIWNIIEKSIAKEVGLND